MLKDLLNAAAAAKAREEERRHPDFESRERAREKSETEIRNAQRIEEAGHVTRLCRELNALIGRMLEGVHGAQVKSFQNLQPFDGLDPDSPDDALQLGEVDAVGTVVEFLGKKLEFSPFCHAIHNAKVRCHWTVRITLNDEEYPHGHWSIESYATEESTVRNAMRIRKGKSVPYRAEEFLESLFSQVFLSR